MAGRTPNPAQSTDADAPGVAPVTTPRQVAEWMIEQIEEGDYLLQVDAVAAIESLFGLEFVYVSEVGEKSIDRRVLYQFRKLTGDHVVWVTHPAGGYCPDAYWRMREVGDGPGRTQSLYS